MPSRTSSRTPPAPAEVNVPGVGVSARVTKARAMSPTWTSRASACRGRMRRRPIEQQPLAEDRDNTARVRALTRAVDVPEPRTAWSIRGSGRERPRTLRRPASRRRRRERLRYVRLAVGWARPRRRARRRWTRRPSRLMPVALSGCERASDIRVEVSSALDGTVTLACAARWETRA